MKRLLGSLVLCGFLTVSLAQAAKTKPVHPKKHLNEAQKEQAKRVKKQNAKVRRQAKARARARKAA